MDFLGGGGGVNQDQHLCSQHCHARSACYSIRTIRQGVSRCLAQSHSSHLGSAFKTDSPPIMPNMHHLATCTTGIDMLDSTVAIVTTEQVTTRITIWPKRGQSKTPNDEAGQWQHCCSMDDGVSSTASMQMFGLADPCRWKERTAKLCTGSALPHDAALAKAYGSRVAGNM